MAITTIYDKYFIFYGKKYNLDPKILKAIAITESNLKQTSVGDNGLSRGLMQIYNPTWKYLHNEKKITYKWDDMFEPGKNIHTGSLILKGFLQRHNGNLYRAIINYNGHHGKYTKGGVKYLETVLKNYNKITGNRFFVPVPYEDNTFFLLSGILLLIFIIRNIKK